MITERLALTEHYFKIYGDVFRLHASTVDVIHTSSADIAQVLNKSLLNPIRLRYP